jgi:DNA-binding Xre family transcriptional regulator
MIGIKALDNICMILNKQPGELIECIKGIWLDYIDSLYGK